PPALPALCHRQIRPATRYRYSAQGALLTVHPKNVQSRLEAMPWIRSVHVKRQFPSTLLIRVVEKRAVGMVREGDRLFLVDEYGATVKPMEKEDPLMLPIIVSAPGEEKATQVVWLINLLSKHAWLQGRISEAVSYPGGRWTLYTKQGIKLLLSQRIDQELELLKRLQEQYAILDRKVRQVELRISGKAMVRFAL
ncbi:cell division protein FtsQ/DivIB, partial [Candidatus Magnetaquicoccus inordinatus]|uniref:cell division protein FtsQ/DivIB n=1 Tax=Candidatus Magnetaquicoccus inordinatus TaxID=2496818 RepID=UPI00102C7CCC